MGDHEDESELSVTTQGRGAAQRQRYPGTMTKGVMTESQLEQ